MKENSKEEALKNWGKKKISSSPKGVGEFLKKKKKGKFYIIAKCITMLLCSNK
ncbi:unnamed protein product [Cochlearia groenlandica]